MLLFVGAILHHKNGRAVDELVVMAQLSAETTL